MVVMGATGPKVSSRADLHLLGHAIEDGGLVEERAAVPRGTSTAAHQAGAPGDGVGHVALHLGGAGLVVERTHAW